MLAADLPRWWSRAVLSSEALITCIPSGENVARLQEGLARAAAGQCRAETVEVHQAFGIADDALAVERDRRNRKGQERFSDCGTRSVQSRPRRLNMRTRSPSRRQMKR